MWIIHQINKIFRVSSREMLNAIPPSFPKEFFLTAATSVDGDTPTVCKLRVEDQERGSRFQLFPIRHGGVH